MAAAVALWRDGLGNHGVVDPGGALESLRALAIAGDDGGNVLTTRGGGGGGGGAAMPVSRCCSAFRETSRLFLGPDSGYLRLNGTARAVADAALDAVPRIAHLPSGASGAAPRAARDWTELSHYARGHARFYAGDHRAALEEVEAILPRDMT